ncbi:NAD(P)-binding protein [Obba rivulosa]|uniref:NAD(P)-binding protein n=1 Tax=Obba rivulosa TaxID=1052685 RepID=A0A8E2J5L1_9APHY|nr:NAD(P)-binding protein [Obba rivulosa]
MSTAKDISKKLILVVGATGAQGLAVINSLLGPGADGSPSPYAVRAVTRDPRSRRAQELTARGVQCVKGAFDDFPSMLSAFQGVYGAWVNTDGFTVGEEKETFIGIRLFELAKQVGTVHHYVWSSLDNALRKGNYDPEYYCEHYISKARVADWMRSQPSIVSEDNMSWTTVTTGPYMDMLHNAKQVMFGPLNKRNDGTFVFATPIGTGHVAMIALSDLGYFARYSFDHRAETSGQELEVASDMVGWDYLVETFRKVTGQKAEVLYLSYDEWCANFDGIDKPVANERKEGEGATTWRENFSKWWALYRDNLITRDMGWIRKINPRGHTLESWMREKGYTGELELSLLKNFEDGKGISPNWEKISQL